MSLFEIADDEQSTPVEVADHNGRPSLRLRRGTPITAALLNELNDLIGTDTPSYTTHSSVAEVASIPIPSGVIRVDRYVHWKPGDPPGLRIVISLIGSDGTDTADLTVAAALAVADTLRQAALEA